MLRKRKALLKLKLTECGGLFVKFFNKWKIFKREKTDSAKKQEKDTKGEITKHIKSKQPLKQGEINEDKAESKGKFDNEETNKEVKNLESNKENVEAYQLMADAAELMFSASGLSVQGPTDEEHTDNVIECVSEKMEEVMKLTGVFDKSGQEHEYFTSNFAQATKFIQELKSKEGMDITSIIFADAHIQECRNCLARRLLASGDKNIEAYMIMRKMWQTLASAKGSSTTLNSAVKFVSKEIENVRNLAQVFDKTEQESDYFNSNFNQAENLIQELNEAESVDALRLMEALNIIKKCRDCLGRRI